LRRLCRSGASWSLALAIASSTALSCSQADPEGDTRVAQLPPERPDIILVVIDALRRDHLGIYGYDRPTSPFMDSLADEGLVFDYAFSHGSQTFNSTASLLTSRYFPYVVPRTPDDGPISDLAPEMATRHARSPVIADLNLTVAEVLEGVGYQTLGIFTNPHHHSTSGFWQGFESARYLKPERRNLPYAGASRVHEAFFEWYDTERKGRPYFAYLHFMDVHNPYRPPRALRRQFVEVDGRDLFVNGVPDLDRASLETDLQYTIGLYDAEIRFVDLVLENLFSGLSERDGRSRTLVIVTSDHGDEFMDRGGLGHGRHLAPEMVHIPLFAYGPGIVARHDITLVRQIDLAPTLVELAGAAAPPEFEGVSLTPRLFGSAPSSSESPSSSFAWVDDQRSLTTDEWHLTSTLEPGSTRLYDLDRDPTARRDVAADHPEVVTALLGELDQIEERRRESARKSREWIQRAVSPAPEAIDPEIREQLEALGYLGN